MAGKTVKSFSVDEDVANLLSERDDLNASAVVNKFLREYVAEGQGEEAALRVRLEQLDDEIAELEKELKQKRERRNQIKNRLRDRESELREQLLEAEQIVRNSPQFWDGDPNGIGTATPDVDPENDMIQKYATEAGVPATRFADELEARL